VISSNCAAAVQHASAMVSIAIHVRMAVYSVTGSSVGAARPAEETVIQADGRTA
jgi:hypothetical protein